MEIRPGSEQGAGLANPPDRSRRFRPAVERQHAPQVLLVGGGHAHLSVLETLSNARSHAAQVTLISPSRHQRYSGMVPGWMMGEYADTQCDIDLLPLCLRAGVELVIDRVAGMDADRQCVALSSGSWQPYDVLSLDVGSETDTSVLHLCGPPLIPIRPVADFCTRWAPLARRILASTRFRLVVVGAGAAGVEVAFAIRSSCRGLGTRLDLALVTGRQGILPDYGKALRRRVGNRLRQAGIVQIQQDAAGADDGLILADGSAWPADAVIATTGARSPVWLSLSRLQRDEAGFVAVDASHRSLSHRSVFAAGDVCARVDRTTSKSGVHAVKAGVVLAHNILASLRGRPLLRYRPRSHTLSLFNCGGGEAIAAWGPILAEGRWVRRWKDHIDRGYIRRLSDRRGLDPSCSTLPSVGNTKFRGSGQDDEPSSRFG